MLQGNESRISPSPCRPTRVFCCLVPLDTLEVSSTIPIVIQHLLTPFLIGSILVSLEKLDPQAHFKTIVKSADQTDPIRAAGAEPVVGSYDDHKLITDLSSESDIVINAADVDVDALVNALLDGQKRRRAGGKPAGSFIQLIGINSFLDGSKSGNFNPGAKVWTVSWL